MSRLSRDIQDELAVIGTAVPIYDAEAYDYEMVALCFAPTRHNVPKRDCSFSPSSRTGGGRHRLRRRERG